MAPLSSKDLSFVWFLIPALAWLAGMPIGLMDVDAAQYAAIAREMLDSGQWLQVTDRTWPYLDKPPLTFWTAALSFKLLGVGLWQYRLPSVLVSVLGMYATYRLGRSLHSEVVGRLAAWVLATCQAFFLMHHDVRTDTLLTGLTITAIWQLYEYGQSRRWVHALWATLALAGALLAKGPIGLMVPVLALGSHWVLRKEWSTLFRWQWLVVGAGVLLLLAPMTWGLYQQYGWKGPQFFFWTQSFGRLTGENVWKNEVYFAFLFENSLWAMLPYTLFYVLALLSRVVRLPGLMKQSRMEWISLLGFVLPYIALAKSQYQLPHYLFVTFPLVAILTAWWLAEVLPSLAKPWQRLLGGFHVFVMLGLWALGGVLALWCFPVGTHARAGLYAPVDWGWAIGGLWGLGGLALAYILFRFSGSQRLVYSSLLGISVVNVVLNMQVYPALLTYQSPTVFVRWAEEKGLSPQQLATYKNHGYSGDFAARMTIPEYTNPLELIGRSTNESFYLLVTEEGKGELEQNGIRFQEVERLVHFHITTLTPEFLNPETRSQAVETRYILQLGPHLPSTQNLAYSAQ